MIADKWVVEPIGFDKVGKAHAHIYKVYSRGEYLGKFSITCIFSDGVDYTTIDGISHHHPVTGKQLAIYEYENVICSHLCLRARHLVQGDFRYMLMHGLENNESVTFRVKEKGEIAKVRLGFIDWCIYIARKLCYKL